MNRKYRVLVISLALVGILSSVWFSGHGRKNDSTQKDVHTLDSCVSSAGGKSTLDGECLHQEVAQLLDARSPADILSYVATASSSALTLRCHDIAHVVGEETLKKYSSLESALAQCTSTCNDGCTHGAIGAEIAREIQVGTGPEYTQDFVHADPHTIEVAGKKYCDASDALCHGVGHILYLASQSYLQAAQLCGTIATGTNIEYCAKGVFMEAFEHNLFSAGSATSSTDKQIPAQPCTSVPKEFQHACFFYFPSLTYMRAQGNPTFNLSDVRASTIRACESLSGQARSYCFEGFGDDAGISEGEFGPLFSDVEQLCTTLPNDTDQASCTLGVAEKYIRYERYTDGLAYCSRIENQTSRTLCSNTMSNALKAAHKENLLTN